MKNSQSVFESQGRTLRSPLLILAAAGSAMAIGSSALAQQVVATWNGGIGNWTDTNRWGISPYYPNNGQGIFGPSTTYRAVINSAGIITLGTSVTIDQLDMTAGILNVTFGTLQAPVINLSGPARLQLSNGVLQNCTLNVGLTGQTLQWDGSSGNYLDHCTINGNVSPSAGSGSVRVINGLTLNGRITMSGSAQLTEFVGSQSLTGNAEILFSGTTGIERSMYLHAGDTLTLGSGVRIHGGFAFLESEVTSVRGHIVNQGIISADAAGQTLTIENATISNLGTLEAINGGTLRFLYGGSPSSAWSSTGLIRAAGGGTVTLDGQGYTLNGSTFDTSGGTVNIGGVLNNNGATLALGSSTGSWRLTGRIDGGTVTTAGGHRLVVAPTNTARLQNVTLAGTAEVQSGTLEVDGGTVSGAINALSGSVVSFLGSWSMPGALTSDNANVNFGGTFSFAPGFTFNRTGGTVALNGILDNTGQTLRLDASTGSWNFNGGTIIGGSVQLADGSTLTRAGTLQGVTLDGTIVQSGVLADTWRIRDSLTGGGLTVSLDQSEIRMENSVNLSGTALSLLGTTNSSASPILRMMESGSTLTLDAGASLHFAQGGFRKSGDPSAALVNNGLIISEGAGRELNFYGLGLTFTNNGTLRATNGSRFLLRALTGNLGHAEIIGAGSRMETTEGGVLTIDQTVDVSDGGSFTAIGSTIVNSTISAATGGSVTLIGFGGQGPTINGAISVSSGTLSLGGSWLNNGSITLTNSTADAGGDYAASALTSFLGSGSTVRVTGLATNTNNTLTLTGTGPQVVLGGGTIRGGIIETSGGAALETAPGTSSNLNSAPLGGGGTQGVTLNGTLNVVNATVSSLDFTNNGTVNVSSSGTFNLNGAWTNNGTIDVNNATLNLGGTVSLSQVGTITRSGAAQVNLTGTLSAPGQTFPITTTTLLTGVSGTGQLTVGTLDLQGGAQLAISQSGRVNADLIAGDGTLLLGSSQSSPGLSPASGSPDGGTLTIGPGATVRGLGRVGRVMTASTSDTLINNGLILADTPGTNVALIISSRTFDNQGALEVNGGTLSIQPSANPLVQGDWTNNGVIRLLAGTLNLGGRTTTAGLGSLQVSGGEVVVSGRIDNTGSTLTLDPGAAWSVAGVNGRIVGGTIEVGAATLEFRRVTGLSGGGGVVGTTINGNFTAREMVVSGGLTLNGLATLRGSGNAAITFDGTQTVSAGVFTMFPGESGFANFTNGTTTFAPGVEFGGASLTGNSPVINQGHIYAPTGASITISAPVRNEGLIEAMAGSTITLDSQSQISNPGTIRVGAGATASFFSTFSFAGGTLENNGGLLDLRGTLNNAGSTFTISAAQGTTRLRGGRINGGTVDILPGGALVIEQTPMLDGVALNGNLEVGVNGLNINNGLTLNGTVHFSNAATNLTLGGVPSLSGGTYFFDFPSGTHQVIIPQSATPTPFGAGTTVRGGNFQIGFTTTQPPNSPGQLQRLANAGTIRADVPGQIVNVYVNELVNTGSLEATNGGVLNLDIRNSGAGAGLGQTFVSTGTILVDGGTLNLGGRFTTADVAELQHVSGTFVLAGSMENTGSTLTLDGAARSWALQGSHSLGQPTRITGGIVRLLNGANLNVANGGSGTLDDVTIEGDLTIVGGALSAVNDTQFTDTVSIGQGGSIYTAASGTPTSKTLESGTFVFNGLPQSGSAARIFYGHLTIGENALVRGGSGVFQTDTGLLGGGFRSNFTNNGLVSADVPGQMLVITPNALTNNGTLEASNGGTLVIRNVVSSLGTIRVNSATLEVAGGETTFVPTLLKTNATVQFVGDILNTGQTLDFDAGTNWLFLNGLRFKGGTINIAGTLPVAVGVGNGSGTTLDGVTINGNMALSSTSSGSFEIQHDLNLNGTFTVGTPGATVAFRGDQTFVSGTIFLDPTQPGADRNIWCQNFAFPSINGANLTIGTNAIIRGGRGSIYSRPPGAPDGSLLNQGLISADIAGTTLTIYQTRFTNAGTVQAINGGNIVLSGPPPLWEDPEPFLNLGVLLAGPGSMLDLNILENDSASGLVFRATGAETYDDYGRLGAVEIRFDGGLRFEWYGAEPLAVGHRFNLLDFERGFGQFRYLELPPLADGLSWDTTQLYTDGTIGVIPAPGAAMLAGIGLALAARRRRS